MGDVTDRATAGDNMTRREFLATAAGAMVVAAAPQLATAAETKNRPDAAALSQLDRVRATFRPRRTDDLRPGVEDWIGVTVTWVAWKLIPEGHRFAGEWAMLPEGDVLLPVRWSPSGDLEMVEVTR